MTGDRIEGHLFAVACPDVLERVERMEDVLSVPKEEEKSTRRSTKHDHREHRV